MRVIMQQQWFDLSAGPHLCAFSRDAVIGQVQRRHLVVPDECVAQLHDHSNTMVSVWLLLCRFAQKRSVIHLTPHHTPTTLLTTHHTPHPTPHPCRDTRFLWQAEH